MDLDRVEEFKLAIYRAYQPIFQLVGIEILAIGMARGCFRVMDPGRGDTRWRSIFNLPAIKLSRKRTEREDGSGTLNL